MRENKHDQTSPKLRYHDSEIRDRIQQAIQRERLGIFANAAFLWNIVAQWMDWKKYLIFAVSANQVLDRVYVWEKVAKTAESANLTVKASYAYIRLSQITNDPLYLYHAARNRMRLARITQTNLDYDQALTILHKVRTMWENTVFHTPEQKQHYLQLTSNHIAEITAKLNLPVAMRTQDNAAQATRTYYTHNPYGPVRFFRGVAATAAASPPMSTTTADQKHYAITSPVP